MGIRVYNTKSKALEDFEPQREGELRVYHCGPTVYGVPSIGNYRSFLFADILRRHFEMRNFKVHQVMNITDVGHLQHDDTADAGGEDKLQAQAKKENKDPWQIADHYTKIFFKERDALHILTPHENPKATDHIPEMITIIKTLIEKGFAYEVNGNIYYRVNKFKNYGKLSGNTLDQLNAGARIEVNDEKENPHDFALWKQDSKHIMQWDSPWGKGFPGWHIECSAMSMKYLGETLDIHTGGEDNIFPHHECEIAQSEGFTGKPFANYWMHARFLVVDGEKMSKSKGNFYLLDDLTQKGYSMRAIRYALSSIHYRQKMNFTLQSLEAANNALERIDECARNWKQPTRKTPTQELIDRTELALEKYGTAMDDDLNVSQALSEFFTLVSDINKIKTHENDVEPLNKAWIKFDKWFGAVLPWEKGESISEGVQSWVDQREQARKDKNFSLADELRDKIAAAGYTVKDTPQGPRAVKK